MLQRACRNEIFFPLWYRFGYLTRFSVVKKAKKIVTHNLNNENIIKLMETYDDVYTG